MDNESIVYGCIKPLPFGDERQRKASCFHNRRAVRALPEADESPFLGQDMFAFSADPGGGGYQTQVIHFGQSYRAVEYEWAHWIAKFERLLKQMYWVSAVVHLDTELAGTHTFHWDCADDYHEPSDDPLRVRCEWSREGNLV
ncbi:hypothetical protein [Alloalcanivorax marinus]|uniref:hypothetical protein n=1 Tax=Alloalcanivorax marinus TaxID=1177169 RepID=UPI0021D25FC4|nr:hypothetical protein [Alloalcanivorax marinus]MCU5788193.1 hypothetical protein [Alloalcanivorax marinus]